MRFINLSERPLAVVHCCTLLAGLCGFLRPAPAAAQTDPRFGAMTHFAQGISPTWAPTVASLNIATVRDELYWNQVETSPGVYSFAGEFDNYMAALQQNAIAPFIILDWGNQYYDSDDTPYDATGYAGYSNYAAAVLQHYGSQIKALEVWNEYNGTWCTGPATNNRPLYYTQMLQAAYAKIKALRPDVTVAGGATAGIALSYWEQLMQQGALSSMDVLSVHPYRYNTPPEGIEKDIMSLQTLTQKYNNGAAKPIWVSEIGWQIQSGNNTTLNIDAPTQAEYLVRAYALLLSAGVQRVYWYDYSDDTGLSVMGLATANNVVRNSGYALQNMVSELTGAAFTQKEPATTGLYSILFTRTDGTPVRVMWSLTPITFAATGISKMVDISGNAIPVTGSVSLSESPLFVEGPLVGLPPATETLLTDSQNDFSSTQGQNGWSYGAYTSGTNFSAFPTYSDEQWMGNYSYGTVTPSDQHPSVNGSLPIPVVRRWTSTYNGNVHIAGYFQAENLGAGGDGIGVTILLNGQPVTVRTLIGSDTTTFQQDFDFVLTVKAGDVIDFVTDPGPAANMNYDATTVEADISTSVQAGTFLPGAAGAFLAGVAPVANATTITDLTTSLGGTASSGSTGSTGGSSNATTLATGTVLADANAGFAGTQGQNGWWYGNYSSGTTFQQLPTYASGTWSTSQYSYLTVTAGDQHPSVNGSTPVSAVRRWVSTYAGTVQITGNFNMENTGGDGVGVTINDNGQPIMARTLLGNSSSAATQEMFSFTQQVAVGDTIDFVVDPGPAANMNYDATAVTATITVAAAGSSSSTGSGSSSTGTSSTSGSSPSLAAGTILANADTGFSGTQGQDGWWYGDYSSGTSWEQLTSYASGSWGSQYPYASITATDQHPSVWNNAPIPVVRRWVSTYAGSVQITGNFNMENTGGDGVGVTINDNGQSIMARTVLGTSSSAPTQQTFSLTQQVAVGDTIDFVVDPGPGTNINFDATALTASIAVADSSGATTSTGSTGSTSTSGDGSTSTTGTASSGSSTTGASTTGTSTTGTSTTGTSSTSGTSGSGTTSTSSGSGSTTASAATDTNTPASVQANFAADFALTQGANGWSYGYFLGAPGAIGPANNSVFLPMTVSGSSWSANYPSLAITASSLAPSTTASIIQVAAVNRWTSNYSGSVQVTGSFQVGHSGDGVGVTIFVNGQPVVARQLIGEPGPNYTATFSFTQAVTAGTTIDFVVDPGPGRDSTYDSTAFTAAITSVGAPTAAGSSSSSSSTTSTSGSTSSGSTTTSSGTTSGTSSSGGSSTTGTSSGSTTTSSGSTSSGGTTTGTSTSAPAATVNANAVNDFSLTQGQNGWSYGYFAGTPGTIGPSNVSNLLPMTAGSVSWTGPYSSLAITATTLWPSASGIVQYSAVRRWTSTVAGNVQVAGSFQIGHNGDGVGVTILVNGQPVVARQLIGEPGPNYTATFSFTQAVAPGTTIDFVVDPGPGRDYSNDSTTFSATITTAP